MLSFHLRVATGVALLALLAGLSGCGGSSDDPDSATSVSPSQAPTSAPPSKKPRKAEPKPLSRYENNPAVKITRKWAVAYAHDINANHPALPTAAAFETAHGRDVVPNVAKTDIGLHYPGPVPFTPVAVNTAGPTTRVTICLMEDGFSTKPGKPAGKKKTGPAVFIMKKVNGAWRIDDLQVATADCSGVKVKGVRW